VKMLLNPMMVQMIAVFFAIGAVMVFAFIVIKALRRDLVSSSELQNSNRADMSNFAIAACQGVIANLKSKEQELLTSLAVERCRVTALEASSNLVLDNIATGVVTVSSSLLVMKANRAARTLLGFASPLNMHVKEIFRGLQTVELPSTNGALTGISQAFRDVIANGAMYRDVPAAYCTPGGDKRRFHLQLIPAPEAMNLPRCAVCFIVMAESALAYSAVKCSTESNSAEAE
jgi:nitrogen fixation/metabolism regulation signal transduction histidine kinase